MSFTYKELNILQNLVGEALDKFLEDEDEDLIDLYNKISELRLKIKIQE